MKSPEYMRGFTEALVHLSDIFELHSDAFLKKGLLRKKDTRLVVNICNACICRREVLSELGAKGVNLFVAPDRSAKIKEK